MSVLYATFFVPGKVKPKKRPRFGAGGNVFTPTATSNQEKTAAIYAAQGKRRYAPRQLPLKVCVTAIIIRPNKPSRCYPPRPDVDNAVKLVLDACNGVIWEDDSQVTQLHAQKRYVNDLQEEPGVHVDVWEAD